MPTPAGFATNIAPDVIRNCINTGIFPSVVIAQAMQESGFGSSKLAQQANNLFGHAAGETWIGRKIQTVKGGRFWRVYDSIGQCIAAHVHVLNKPVYKLAGVTIAKTPFEQVLALQKAGYDSGPDKDEYALKLAKLIKQHQLQFYDDAMFARERKLNTDHLAAHERDTLKRVINTITT